jgi:hypothetical protein
MFYFIILFLFINYFLYKQKEVRDQLTGTTPLVESSSFKKNINKFKPFFLLVILFLIFTGCKVVQKNNTDEIYFTESLLPHHFVWHSAFIGLKSHPSWNNNLPDERLRNREGDDIPFSMTTFILKDLDIPHTGGISRGLMKARLHDETIKAAFFEYIYTHLGYVLDLYLFIKPQSIASVLVTLFASIPGWKWFIFSPLILLSLYVKKIESSQRFVSIPNEIFIINILLLILASWLPALWAYPGPATLSDQLCIFIFVIMLLPYLLIKSCSSWLRFLSKITHSIYEKINMASKI